MDGNSLQFSNLLILLVLVVFFLTEDIDESVCIFSPDTYPHQRQLYQLCDLRDDTLQAIKHSSDGRDQMLCNKCLLIRHYVIELEKNHTICQGSFSVDAN